MAKKILQFPIRYGCITYTVMFPSDLEGLHGETDRLKKIVSINSRDSIDIQRETLFHEILHVAFEDIPIFKFNYQGKEEELEEDIIRYISPKMVQLLQDNKKLRDFILGK